MVLVDLASDNSSHVGRAIIATFSGNGSGLVEIAQRKFAMNLQLLRTTIWTHVLIAAIVVLSALHLRGHLRFGQLRKENRSLWSGFIALAAGIAAALLFNDSGVIAAAAALIFGVGAILFRLLTQLASPRATA